MSYKYYEIKDGRKFSDLTEEESAYIRKEWDRLCSRTTTNTSERIFIQKPNGRFFEALRGRIAPSRYSGCAGGYWTIRYGDCKRWGFRKNPFAEYDPEPVDKYFNALSKSNGEIVQIPASVHTKKDALELARKLGFEI